VVKVLSSVMGRTCSSVGGSGKCVHNLCLLHFVYIRVICYGHIVTNISAYKLFGIVLNCILQLGVVCILFHFVMTALTHVVGSCTGQV
jgi:hypothetical protein